MNQFLETFLKEWDLYQKQGGTPTVDDCRTSEHAGDFDKPVRAGEIRVFSDSNRQLVGLVYKSWGDKGWIVIPVSDFSVPATEQEILIGSRVFQLWNAFTASVEFTEKSWLVDTLSLDDLQDICAALLHTTIGEPLRGDLASCLGEKITSAEDPRLEYERTFVLKMQREDVSESDKMARSWLTREVVMHIWRERKLDVLPLAAATRVDVSPFVANKRSWKGEGCNASDFDGYYAGEEPKTVVFTLNTPDGADLVGKRVEAFTKNGDIIFVGAGNVYEDGGEIKVDITMGEVNSSVEVARVSDLVLVLAEGNM